MRRRYHAHGMTLGAWQRAIVLAYLARAGLPLTRHTIGGTLALDQTTLSKRLAELIEIGAVSAERGRDRRRYYFATQVVRMAAA